MNNFYLTAPTLAAALRLAASLHPRDPSSIAGAVMAKVCQFGIIPVFADDQGNLSAQCEIIFESEGRARRAGKVFADALGGAIAFSRLVDESNGNADDGVIIERFGVMAGKGGGKRHLISRASPPAAA